MYYDAELRFLISGLQKYGLEVISMGTAGENESEVLVVASYTRKEGQKWAENVGHSLDFADKRGKHEESSMEQIRELEQRYACENALMQAVSEGQNRKVEQLWEKLSDVSMEQRVKEPVRNMKNNCIIMNTLLRKAAEKGGVHPLYLDKISSDVARRIERARGVREIQKLMVMMPMEYCSLVRKHAIHCYSPQIQRTIAYIDTDLTADLSLRALAVMQNVSAGYLSSLFKQETGQNLTEYVNRRRIKHAVQLLEHTKWQIQTIAQHCGIVDVHYFSKLFKKYMGMPPREYRMQNRQKFILFPKHKHWD